MCNTKISNRRPFSNLAPVATLLLIYCMQVNAQTCSTADIEIFQSTNTESVQALLNGDLTQFRTLQREMPSLLSASCRDELNRLQPMRLHCSDTEKNKVLTHLLAATQSGYSGDFVHALDLMIHLEDNVSTDCWLAAMRHTDPKVLNSCSTAELDHMSGLAGPLIRATRNLLETLDFTELLNLTQQGLAPISQGCQYALAEFQQKQNQQLPNGGNSPGSYRPNNVYDHGGGTYSVPGTGACTSSGCIAF